eukprot:6439818-Alexandrium_andersonii.AAC.1
MLGPPADWAIGRSSFSPSPSSAAAPAATKSGAGSFFAARHYEPTPALSSLPFAPPEATGRAVSGLLPPTPHVRR